MTDDGRGTEITDDRWGTEKTDDRWGKEMTDDRWGTEKTDEPSQNGRAVSEVVGYIIVFGLVITSIGIITVAGTGTLEDAREDERVSNAERAFDVVADNMVSIYERNSPSRATEIDLPNSQIIMGNEIRMTVTVDGETVAQRDIQPIEFRLTDDRRLVYEAGAVFRTEHGGGVVLRDPPFLLDDDRVHVPIVETESPGAASAGSTTILLRGKATERSVLASRTDENDHEVTIEMQTSRNELWERTLSADGMDCETEGTAVSCTLTDVDTVYVTHHRIEVSLIL